MKMVEVQILGTTLKAALLNPATAKQFEDGFNKACFRIRAAAGMEGANGPEQLEEQCNAVIDYIDDTFGSGSARKAFGDEIDFLTCLDALEQMATLYEQQVNPVIKEKTERINEILGLASVEGAASEGEGEGAHGTL